MVLLHPPPRKFPSWKIVTQCDGLKERFENCIENFIQELKIEEPSFAYTVADFHAMWVYLVEASDYYLGRFGHFRHLTKKIPFEYFIDFDKGDGIICRHILGSFLDFIEERKLDLSELSEMIKQKPNITNSDQRMLAANENFTQHLIRRFNLPIGSDYVEASYQIGLASSLAPYEPIDIVEFPEEEVPAFIEWSRDLYQSLKQQKYIATYKIFIEEDVLPIHKALIQQACHSMQVPIVTDRREATHILLSDTLTSCGEWNEVDFYSVEFSKFRSEQELRVSWWYYPDSYDVFLPQFFFVRQTINGKQYKMLDLKKLRKSNYDVLREAKKGRRPKDRVLRDKNNVRRTKRSVTNVRCRWILDWFYFNEEVSCFDYEEILPELKTSHLKQEKKQRQDARYEEMVPVLEQPVHSTPGVGIPVPHKMGLVSYVPNVVLSEDSLIKTLVDVKVNPHLNAAKQVSQIEYVTPEIASWFNPDSVSEVEIKTLGIKGAVEYNRYRKVRNFCVSAYRMNPSIYFSVTAARRALSVDVNYIYKVHCFLERWGLINYSGGRQLPNPQQRVPKLVVTDNELNRQQRTLMRYTSEKVKLVQEYFEKNVHEDHSTLTESDWKAIAQELDMVVTDLKVIFCGSFTNANHEPKLPEDSTKMEQADISRDVSEVSKEIDEEIRDAVYSTIHQEVQLLNDKIQTFSDRSNQMEKYFNQLRMYENRLMDKAIELRKRELVIEELESKYAKEEEQNDSEMMMIDE
ncbi:hypothetical protein PCE1_003617 [Barthelona sp. PCE]